MQNLEVVKKREMIIKSRNPFFKPFIVTFSGHKRPSGRVEHGTIKDSFNITENSSNIIILYGLSAIAGAILLTNTHNQPLNRS